MAAPEMQRGPGGGLEADRLSEQIAAEDSRTRTRSQPSPLTIAARLVPHGCVPAVVRDRGRLVPHHCPRDVAERLRVEGSA
jgi:hypothetical protein